MRRYVKSAQAGFSLIELMVVVAIIGILAAIAVPNFQKFQMKARQSEAKANLGGIASAEKAFFAQWNRYYSHFPAIGFAPDGRINYRIGFSAAGPNIPNTVGYGGPNQNGAGGANAATIFSSVQACGAVGFNCQETTMASTVGGLPANAQVTGATANNFRAGASGRINPQNAVDDQWTIDQNNLVLNPSSAL